jgi:hypothetical protein
MSDDTQYAYLVLVRVVLIGGSREAAVDVFPAESHSEAENMARNAFTQAPAGQGLMFGDRFFQPEAVASMTAKSLAIIDLSVGDNYLWKQSLDLFGVIAGEGHVDGQTKQDRYFENSAEDTGRGVHY